MFLGHVIKAKVSGISKQLSTDVYIGNTILFVLWTSLYFLCLYKQNVLLTNIRNGIRRQECVRSAQKT